MKTIEIWPKEIEFGDAISPELTITYLRLTDPEDGVQVIAMLRPEALQTAVDQLSAIIAAQRQAH